MDKENALESLIARLEEHGMRYCLIGGQAVNAYVEPLVSLEDVLQGKMRTVHNSLFTIHNYLGEQQWPYLN